MTICQLALCRVLKVWKNSSLVPSLFSRNWMSSTRSTSTSRYHRLADRDGRRVREPVARPDHEGLERVLGVQPGAAGPEQPT